MTRERCLVFITNTSSTNKETALSTGSSNKLVNNNHVDEGWRPFTNNKDKRFLYHRLDRKRNMYYTMSSCGTIRTPPVKLAVLIKRLIFNNMSSTRGKLPMSLKMLIINTSQQHFEMKFVNEISFYISSTIYEKLIWYHVLSIMWLVRHQNIKEKLWASFKLRRGGTQINSRSSSWNKIPPDALQAKFHTPNIKYSGRLDATRKQRQGTNSAWKEHMRQLNHTSWEGRWKPV